MCKSGSSRGSFLQVRVSSTSNSSCSRFVQPCSWRRSHSWRNIKIMRRDDGETAVAAKELWSRTVTLQSRRPTICHERWPRFWVYQLPFKAMWHYSVSWNLKTLWKHDSVAGYLSWQCCLEPDEPSELTDRVSCFRGAPGFCYFAGLILRHLKFLLGSSGLGKALGISWNGNVCVRTDCSIPCAWLTRCADPL